MSSSPQFGWSACRPWPWAPGLAGGLEHGGPGRLVSRGSALSRALPSACHVCWAEAGSAALVGGWVTRSGPGRVTAPGIFARVAGAPPGDCSGSGISTAIHDLLSSHSLATLNAAPAQLPGPLPGHNWPVRSPRNTSRH